MPVDPSLQTMEEAPFVGRSDELAALDLAFRASHGHPIVALVHGESGVGKSALVGRFVERLAVEERDLLVLHGRCWERAPIAYNALDGVVDALAHHLARFSPMDAAACVPDGVGSLVQLFPALRRVRAVADHAEELVAEAPDVDLVDLRGRAFTALRELLRRVGERRPLVLAIDDLHWADDDSLALLSDVLRAPDAPPLLLVATVCTRPGHDAIARFRDALSPTGIELRAIALSRVPLEDAEERSPWSRVAPLPPAARELLVLLAVAGGPVSQGTLARAAEIEGDAFAEGVALLRVSRLVSAAGDRRDDAVGTCRDEVRLAVTAPLDDASRERAHRRLALALETAPVRDPEALFVHWLGAHDDARAAEYAEQAAGRAVAMLAFDRAGRLYEAALAKGAHDAKARAALEEKLGDVRGNAGRGALAARAYRAAAVGADGARSLELRSRAAAQLLRAGHFDEGLDACAEVLAEVGLSFARSSFGALVTLLFFRAWFAVRGLGFRRRDVSLVSARELTRIDVSASIAWQITLADPTQGTAFQQRYLSLALQCGEPARVVRALAGEMALSSTAGTRAWPARTSPLIASTRQLAESVGDARATAITMQATATATYLGSGSFWRALDLSDRAATALRSCTGVAWELAVARLYGLFALVYLGRWDELAARTEPYLRDARARGDLFSLVNGSTGVAACAWLGRDDPAGARRNIESAMRAWPRAAFHLAHYYEALGLAFVDLYEGHGDAALARLDAVWPRMRRSFYLRVQALRIEGLDARARAMLAVAATRPAGDRSPLLARVRDIARRLRHEDARWATAMALLLDAGASHLDGARADTVSLLDEAADAFDAADMALHTTVARWCCASLADKPRDGALRAPDAPVKNFARVVALLAPPFAPKS